MPRAAVATLTQLDRCLEVSKENYKACLDHLDHDLHIDGVDVNLRFHFLKFDDNGRPKFKDLAECLADHLVEYSFSASRRGHPRKPRDYVKLRREARKLLRRTATAGEAGEMLLYFLQEAVLGAPQMVAKLDLKTNPRLESNGSDGIHMRWNDADGCLDIFYGESKLEKSVARALLNAFKSLKKFHLDQLGEHELRMVTSHYKWADGPLKEAVLRYVDRGKSGGDCRVNHACLIGYDWKLYKQFVDEDARHVRELFLAGYAARAPKLRDLLAKRFKRFKLRKLRFEFFFLPFDSVQDFRNAFNERTRLGRGGNSKVAEKISTNLEGQIARLVIADMRDQLPGRPAILWRFDPEEEEFHEELPQPLTTAELLELVSAASLLALSESAGDRTWAYEIVTRALRVDGGETPAIVSAAEVIFARLGNFPGRSLLRRRYQGAEETITEVPPFLSLEIVAREIDNTVEMPSGRELALTDFQLDLFDELETSASASVSAPTSSGKSFILTLDIARRFGGREPASVVYVVPTRALIRQVMLKIAEVFAEEGLQNVPLRCVPIPVSRERAPRGAVYVLTQERLVSLLNSDEGEPWVTTLVIDEAQGVGDGARGIVLHSATDAVIDLFPKAEVFFASPLTKNPGYLLDIFRRREAAPPLIEEHSPVSQNVILLDTINGEPDRVDCRVLVNGKRVYLGEYLLPFRFGGENLLVRRARVAVAVTHGGESTIVYANEPKQTEDLAEEITSLLEPDRPVDPAVADLMKFLREHIHPEYGLIDVLARGVAFHYGAMPSIVRATVEDLFTAGKLQFVCCTSTLLQGVNLPARHIVIENPSRGRGSRMNRRDFLNLAGRAGRLRQEFHGNVWCLSADSWDEKSYQGEVLQPMTSSFEETLADGGTLIRNVLEGTAPAGKLELGTAALGKVFAEFTQAGKSLEESHYRTEQNAEGLRATAAMCAAIRVDLPPEVFRRNATLLPAHLQELYELLKSQPDLRQWVPLPPYESASQTRLKEIFRVVDRLLGRSANESFIYHAWLAGNWIREMPLRELIELRVAWLRLHEKFVSYDDTITDLMDALESDLRYRYTKHLRAYNDVLAFALREAGHVEAAEHLAPLHLYLECGASEHVVLSLIAVGLSRTTAILLRRVMSFPKMATPEECLELIRGASLNSVGLPAICAREVAALCRVEER